MMNPYMMSEHKDQLLRALMNRLRLDDRRKIMLEVPAAYNDYYAHASGKPILTVIMTSTGEPVSLTPED